MATELVSGVMDLENIASRQRTVSRVPLMELLTQLLNGR